MIGTESGRATERACCRGLGVPAIAGRIVSFRRRCRAMSPPARRWRLHDAEIIGDRTARLLRDARKTSHVAHLPRRHSPSLLSRTCTDVSHSLIDSTVSMVVFIRRRIDKGGHLVVPGAEVRRSAHGGRHHRTGAERHYRSFLARPVEVSAAAVPSGPRSRAGLPDAIAQQWSAFGESISFFRAC